MVAHTATSITDRIVYTEHSFETTAAWPVVSLRREWRDLQHGGLQRVITAHDKHKDGTGDLNQALSQDAWLSMPVSQRWERYTSASMTYERDITRGYLLTILLALCVFVARHFERLGKGLFFPIMIALSLRRLKPTTSRGSARWADERAMKELSPSPSSPSIVVGTVGEGRRRRLVALPEWRHYEHIYMVAPPGAGKTSGIIIPNLLTEPGTRTVVITDPKKDILPTTISQLTEVYGEDHVAILDFLNPSISLGYNPLAHIHNATDAQLWAESLVENTGKADKDPFWGNINRDIIAATVLHLKSGVGTPPLVTLADFLAAQSPYDVIEQLAESPSVETRRVARSQLTAIRQNDKLLGSVFTELTGRFRFLYDWRVRAVTSTNEIEFAKLAQEPQALYVPLYMQHSEFLKPIVASFFMHFYSKLSEIAMSSTSGRLKVPVMCYMDEFGVMGKIPRFEAHMATIRSFGIGCLIVVQSAHQLAAEYGREEARIILENANTKLCLSRVSGEDARMFSELAGLATAVVGSRNTTRKTFSVWRDHSTTTHTEMERHLMTPDEIRTMGDDVLVIVADQQPIRAHQRRYYQAPKLRRLAGKGDADAALERMGRPCPLSDPGLRVQEQGPHAGDPQRGPSQEGPERTLPTPAGAVGPENDEACPLTPQQVEILTLMAEGYSNAEIADRLALSKQTVANTVSVLYSQLEVPKGVDQRARAVGVARARGLLPHRGRSVRIGEDGELEPEEGGDEPVER